MKLKAAPCLFLACGILLAPGVAMAKISPHHMHPMPVPNSARTHTT